MNENKKPSFLSLENENEVEFKSFYKKKFVEEITEKEINDPDFIKYEGTNGKRKIIILKCDNCDINFEKTLHSYNQHSNRQNKGSTKNLFCDRNCFFDFIKREKIELDCYWCKNKFWKLKCNYDKCIRTNQTKFFCNKDCFGKSLEIKIELKCDTCGELIVRTPCQINSTNFCTKQCQAKHQIGYRSQLELYIEKQINFYFPYLSVIYSDRNICSNLELDIYIPDLKLAIEINGIYHYKAIHGQDEFMRRQSYDAEKLEICKKKNIELFVVKSIENFEQRGVKERDWNIIKNLIISKIPYCENEENISLWG